MTFEYLITRKGQGDKNTFLLHSHFAVLQIYHILIEGRSVRAG